MKLYITRILKKALPFIILLVLVSPMLLHAGETPSDALFKRVQKKYTLKTDGTMEYQVRKEIRLLSHLSFHRLYGETFVVYDPQYQDLKINECYTVMADGKKVVTPPNAFNQVLPRAAANAPAYNRLIEMVITHTALEIGATIYLDYTITSKKDFLPAFMGFEKLCEPDPVEVLDLQVAVPAGMNLNYTLNQWKGDPEISTSGTTKTWSWHFTRLPAYHPETLQPPEGSFLPSLAFSTVRNIQEMTSRWFQQSAFRYEGNDEMTRWARQWKEKKQSDLDWVLTLQDKIVNEVQLLPLQAATVGFRARTVEEVFLSAYATELEKAVLFTTLLDLMHIKAGIVAMVPGNHVAQLPGMFQWEHFLVGVYLKDADTLLLSFHTMNDQNLLMDQSRTCFTLPEGKPIRYRFSDGQPNEVKLECKLTLDTTNTLTGSGKLLQKGLPHPYLSLLKNPGKANKAIRGGLTSKDLKECKIVEILPGTGSLDLSIEKKNACRVNGGYCFLKWPQPANGVFSWHTGELPATRLNTAQIPYPLVEWSQSELELPEGWNLVNPLEKYVITNTAGSLSMACTQSGNKISLEWKASLKEWTGTEPGAAYYNDLKVLLNQWYAFMNREAMFKQKLR